jgi:hypothetical protein
MSSIRHVRHDGLERDERLKWLGIRSGWTEVNGAKVKIGRRRVRQSRNTWTGWIRRPFLRNRSRFLKFAFGDDNQSVDGADQRVERYVIRDGELLGKKPRYVLAPAFEGSDGGEKLAAQRDGRTLIEFINEFSHALVLRVQGFVHVILFENDVRSLCTTDGRRSVADRQSVD